MGFRKKLFFLAVLFMGILPFSAFSQFDTVAIKTIIEKTQKLAEQHPAEKVYLHFDKPYYAVGDTIWFKAYLTTTLNIPSPLSKVVYVDIISERDSLVRTIRLPVSSGAASGNFTLAQQNFKEGNYRVRAYSSWMLNFGDAYFFNKVIPVGNTLNKNVYSNITFSGRETDKAANLEAKIAYKDQNGKPLANKKVNWRIVSKYQTIGKGKGVTDQNGFLTLSSTADLKDSLALGQLETDIELTDQRPVTKAFSLAKAFNKPDLQFFPEGGRLIAGITSKVGFKAIKSDGLGIEVKGVVTDNTGKTVAEFESHHLGMGQFSFIPESGKTYSASVTYADGSKASVNLPKLRTSGIVLAVNNTGAENVVVSILSSDSYLERHKGEVFSLVARTNGAVAYAAQVRLQNTVYSANVPKSKFPPGVSEFTLFTPTGSAVSERIVFIQPAGTHTVRLSSDRQEYTVKQKVKMNIATTAPEKPAAGTYSLSVIDETKVPYSEDNETSILSTLLLTSDLKGYVERPNYYFHKVDEKKIAHLDLLMLTQGYRAFDYRDILEDKSPPVLYFPEQGIQISGTLRMFSGLPVNKGTIQFLIPDKNYSVSTQTDAEGKFRFTNLVFTDSTNVILSARSNPNSKNMIITVDGLALPTVTPNYNSPDEIVNLDSTLNPYLQNSKRQYRTSVVLEEVEVRGRVTPKASHRDYPTFSGLGSMADQTISADRLTSCPILFNCLRAGVMGLVFADENFYVSRDYNQGSRVPVQIFVGDMPVDANYLNTVNTQEVESVEVFLRDQLGTINRTYNTNGVLIVHMKKKPKGTSVSLSQLEEILPKSNIINFTPMGYQKARQFYSPKYDVAKGGPIVNDLRTTIYWNPMIVPDAEGKANVEFFNADGRGSYKAVIEGLDAEGNLYRTIYRYSVK